MYGPFSMPPAVTRLGSETTYTTPDAYGRHLRGDDPDRGTTATTFDGFGEVLTVDDALTRHYAFTYDAIGRRVQRDDTVNGVTLPTRWAYDTAPHGVGSLATVTSPDGHVDAYTYDALSQPQTHTLTLGDTGESFSSTLYYDTLGRVSHITYPSAPGVDPLEVRREYDAFGNLVAVHDDATATTFWQVERLDGAGRATREGFGNFVAAQHAYAPSTGLVQHVGASWTAFPRRTPLQASPTTTTPGCGWTPRTDDLQAGPRSVRRPPATSRSSMMRSTGSRVHRSSGSCSRPASVRRRPASTPTSITTTATSRPRTAAPTPTTRTIPTRCRRPAAARSRTTPSATRSSGRA